MIFFIRMTFRWIRRITKWTFVLSVIALIGVVVVFGYAIAQGPPSLMTEQNTVYYSQDQSVIGEDHGVEERYWTNIEDMPSSIKEATIAIEDRRFYNHFGFDLKRIAAAALTDLKHMSMVEGASTITQQYARNLYLSHDKTWKRKLMEAFYALRLEIFYDKDEILEGYLNTIYYGHGAYGVEAASRYYFNKPSQDLSLTESAMLAGIPKGPSYYSPLANEENAESRQELILSEMEKNGFISSSEKTEAVTASLTYSSHSDETEKEVAPYFQDQVLTEASTILGIEPEAVKTGGYHIYTTLIPEHQKVLEEKVQETIPKDDDTQTAGAILDSETGAVTALIGGKSYEQSPFNRATQAKRHIGSTIKPFLYYQALAEGYSPVTMVESKPTEFDSEEGKTYAPANFNNQYAEAPITMAQALAVSDNIYAVSTHVDIGVEKLVRTLQEFGITKKAQPVPSLALGATSVSLYDLLNGYAKLIKGSEAIKSHTIAKITDRHENVLYEYSPVHNEDKEVDPARAFTVTHMMTGMFDSSLDAEYASVTGTPIQGKLTRMYGGKSGTTDFDSWMVGFSPQYLSGIWIGHDEGGKKLEGFNAHRYAKTIWAETMETIHEPLPMAAFIPPPDLKGVYIDPETGFKSGPNCPNKERLVYMEKSDIPKEVCGSDEDRNVEDLEDEFKDDPWFKDVVDWIF
ncbi:penicillin-binding protein [Halobacillus fulvus]|nr:penicillin-binding protein [Halobacillus fulvus]